MSTVRTRPECDFPAKIVLYLFLLPSYGLAMADHDEKLFPATTEDVADALAFALRFYTRNRVNSAHEYMAQITAAGSVANFL